MSISSPVSILDDKSLLYLDTTCGIIPRDKSMNNFCYLLALLNSSLLEFYFKKTTVPKASGFYIYKTMFLEPLPIRTIAKGDEAGKKIRDEIVSLVSKMLELHKRLAPVHNTPYSGRDELLREIASLDAPR